MNSARPTGVTFALLAAANIGLALTPDPAAAGQKARFFLWEPPLDLKGVPEVTPVLILSQDERDLLERNRKLLALLKKWQDEGDQEYDDRAVGWADASMQSSRREAHPA